jgi:hypothetical protein
VLVGIWLILSPFLLPYSSADPAWRDVLLGAVIATLALLRITTLLWESWMSWINVALGAFLIISTFWLAESDAATWNGALAGGLGCSWLR